MNDLTHSLSWQSIPLVIMLGFAGLLLGCSNVPGEQSPQPGAGQASVMGTRVLPTIYPTATPFPSPTPASTNTPQPTAVTPTEVAFDQVVVDVAYSIPLLELDRRVRGNVAGQIEVVDQNSGMSVTLKNRPGVVVEMQQALPRATIEELPAGCEACVQVEYELPLTEQTGQGWLRDIQLLASLENYTAVVLGPHFPPGTIAGLRRGATPYEVAHSAAITSEGRLWTWTAIEDEISPPTMIEGLQDQAAGYLALIDWSTLPESVGHICYQGGGAESLLLDGPGGLELVEVRCPELYLPGQLVPIYSALSEAVGERLQGSEVAPPDLSMTLDTVAYYGRADGAMLNLSAAGQLHATDAEGARYTLTLTTTETLSLTVMMMDSGLLQPGPVALFEEEPGNVILIRAYDNVYELAWREDDEPPAGLVQPWDDLLEMVLRTASPQIGETPQPLPTATGRGG